ncbi:MAG: C69 family dipeptidase [Proteobacteria bacterium]|nr:C69 family dipeptidase [Pseudomonadota bacterium]
MSTGAHTASGSALFAKNSDRNPGECQPFLQLPAAFHPRGARVACTHISIPQVAETYRLMGHSPWWGWGFEQGVNEHAVAIGNQPVPTREPVETKPGLIGMDLVRLGLERGRDAREALEIIAALIETHGQGGSAVAPGEAGCHNSFAIADPQQAWVLETSGRRWAARRTDRAALSNHLQLGSDWQIGSRDLESFARSEGWWRQAERIEFATAYGPTEAGFAADSESRQRRALWLLERSTRLDVSAVQALLRDHDGGAGESADPRNGLCAYGASGSTTASLIAPLPADPTPAWPVWVSFGTPCTGLFLPVYLDGILPAALARGGESPDDAAAWWVFKQLEDAALRDPQRNAPLLRQAWSDLEEKLEAERLGVEAQAARAAGGGDEEQVCDLLTDFMARSVAAALQEAARLRVTLEN